ncbi:MAG: hypothetical protein FJX63_03670 [Alphaproteobacteria bacterium]|nr:hypothetical protein [Alphaproteobacteria bacterium]
MTPDRNNYVPCPAIGRSVSLDQTEGQCREVNRCKDETRCPLERHFIDETAKFRLSAFSAAICRGWLPHP